MAGKRFYFDGIFYDTVEELNKAATQLKMSEICPVSAKRIFEEMTDMLCFKMFAQLEYKKMITNALLLELTEIMVMEFIRRYQEFQQNYDSGYFDERHFD